MAGLDSAIVVWVGRARKVELSGKGLLIGGHCVAGVVLMRSLLAILRGLRRGEGVDGWRCIVRKEV